MEATVEASNPKASQMKLRLLALALMATVASVASAHVLVPLPERVRVLPRSTEQALPPSTAVPPKVPAPPIRSAVASDVTRAPVPVRVAHRRAFVPAVEAAWNPYPSDADIALPAKMTETAARAAIEADGYKSVRALARGSDGAWRASALRGQTEVLLSVGPTGNVSVN